MKSRVQQLPAMDTRALTSALAAVCKDQRDVQLVYVFGSQVRGGADSASDIDIAVLLDSGLHKEERQRLRLRLMRVFAEALDIPIDRIDVVSLQDVPSLLQLNVIRGGKLVYARDPAARITFEMETERRYEDEAPFLEREADLTLQRILAHHS